MAGKKVAKTDVYKCNFCGHKEILVDDIVVGENFELTEDHKKSDKFMKAFNRALELKTICLC